MAIMKASLVITGSEIITGRRVDALVQPFAAQLTAIGITVAEVRMISDAPEMLCSTILELIDFSDLIIVTGGLGLTPDDTTRLAIATLKKRRPPSAEAQIANPVGSAAGIDLRFGTCRVVFLPGVPRESHAMFPLVLDGVGGKIPATIEVPVFGLREVEIAERIGQWSEKCGYLPSEMEIALVAPAGLEAQIRSILGRHALEGKGLARTFGELLKGRGLTCAAAESCTGGLISHLITQVPGSSGHFLGSIVSYSNDVKVNVLGVSREDIERFGAVSEQVARAMLKGVLRLTGADVGMATTGIAGPDGGTDEKPVGTVWICVGTADHQETRMMRFFFDRDGNKMISAKTALFMLRNLIHDQDIHRADHS
jgi:nicotinamide-nucleotide amidase